MRFGSYECFSKGNYSQAIKQAAKNGEETMMVFIGSPRTVSKSLLTQDEVTEIVNARHEYGMKDLVVHAAYVANLGSDDEEKRKKAVELIKVELQNAEMIGASSLVVHPGSSTKGIGNLVRSVNDILWHFGSSLVCKLVIEGMAGKGNELFCTMVEWVSFFKLFSEEEKEHLGICLDTCHFYDVGYDYVKAPNIVAGSLGVCGMSKLIRVIHVNGSANKLNSHKDRHECLYDTENSKIPPEAIEKFIKALNGGTMDNDVSVVIECTSDRFPGCLDAIRLKNAVEELQ